MTSNDKATRVFLGVCAVSKETQSFYTSLTSEWVHKVVFQKAVASGEETKSS